MVYLYGRLSVCVFLKILQPEKALSLNEVVINTRGVVRVNCGRIFLSEQMIPSKSIIDRL